MESKLDLNHPFAVVVDSPSTPGGAVWHRGFDSRAEAEAFAAEMVARGESATAIDERTGQ